MKGKKRPHAMVRKPDSVRQAQINSIISGGLSSAKAAGEREGINKGWILAQEHVQTAVYSAVLLTLKNQLHFGRQRMIKFMQELDSKVWQCLNSDELVAEAYKVTGLEVDLSEVYQEDRIREAFHEAEKRVSASKDA